MTEGGRHEKSGPTFWEVDRAGLILKERRRLVLVARETPLNLAHLRNMVSVTEMGGIVFPPVPASYAKPRTLGDMVNHTVGRLLGSLLSPIMTSFPAGQGWQSKQSSRIEEALSNA